MSNANDEDDEEDEGKEGSDSEGASHGYTPSPSHGNTSTSSHVSPLRPTELEGAKTLAEIATFTAGKAVAGGKKKAPMMVLKGGVVVASAFTDSEPFSPSTPTSPAPRSRKSLALAKSAG